MYDIKQFTLPYVHREIGYNTSKQWNVDAFWSDRLPTEFLLQKASNRLENLNTTSFGYTVVIVHCKILLILYQNTPNNQARTCRNCLII